MHMHMHTDGPVGMHMHTDGLVSSSADPGEQWRGSREDSGEDSAQTKRY